MSLLAKNLQNSLCRPMLLRFFALAWLIPLACNLHANFDIDESGESPIAAASMPEVISFSGLTNLNISKHPSLKTQGLSIDELSSVKIEDASISVIQPGTGEDLSFFNNISFVATASNLPPLTLAVVDKPAKDTNLVALVVVTTAELMPYAKAKDLSIAAHVSYAQAPTNNLTLAGQITLRVAVGEPGGSCAAR